MIYHNNIKFPLILKKLKKLTEPYCTPSPRKETVLFKFPLKNKVADFENIPTEDPDIGYLQKFYLKMTNVIE